MLSSTCFRHYVFSVGDKEKTFLALIFDKIFIYSQICKHVSYLYAQQIKTIARVHLEFEFVYLSTLSKITKYTSDYWSFAFLSVCLSVLQRLHHKTVLHRSRSQTDSVCKPMKTSLESKPILKYLPIFSMFIYPVASVLNLKRNTKIKHLTTSLSALRSLNFFSFTLYYNMYTSPKTIIM